MLNRRQFLHNSALISLAPWIPAFLPRTLQAADAKQDDRILVVIQLDGGNDGLNTVIPFADENYAKHRNQLKVASTDVLKLNDSIGLHPGMRAAADLYHDGRLMIVQGVGYPNHNRSHFESMSIWQHARMEERQQDGLGWLGRGIDAAVRPGNALADSVFVGSEAIPIALRGRRANAISLERESDLTLLTPNEATTASPSAEDLTAFVTRIQADSFQAARQLTESAAKSDSTAGYPSTDLARHLQLISKLIKLGGGARVFYALQDGYDTHVAQAEPHRTLLREFSGAVKAFLDDLKASQLAERVVVVAFSEFGRRVQENGSAGTDHGAAGPVILAGAVRGGLVGDHPSLVDLDQGDLKMSTDFRSVYAALLTDWLGIDSKQPLEGTYPKIELFKRG